MNEPWPGTEWLPCLSGCPTIEQERLVPFHTRMLQAVRSVDPDGRVFAEPFVLFNFGGADTTLPGPGSIGGRHALSTHVYATDATGDLGVMTRSIAAAERDRAPVLTTEWGATNDPAHLVRTADQFDSQLVPWLFWAYNEHVIVDTRRPPTPDNVRGPVVDALTRPYPSAINGTPTRLAFDAASAVLDFEYATTRPDGRAASPVLPTVVNVPESRYPDGYAVTVTGAEVVSEPCAPAIRLRNHAGAASVTVRVVPAACG
jgi:endoglycosylceramidase